MIYYFNIDCFNFLIDQCSLLAVPFLIVIDRFFLISFKYLHLYLKLIISVIVQVAIVNFHMFIFDFCEHFTFHLYLILIFLILTFFILFIIINFISIFHIDYAIL